jgi:hypothetical protein
MIRYEIEDVDFWCGRCDSAMAETDCRSAYCNHQRCLGCGHGCDIELDDGLCAHASAETERDDRIERIYLRDRLRPVRTVHIEQDLL